MDIGSLLLGLALLVAIAFVVVRPLLEQTPAPDQPASPADLMLDQREQVLAQLRDLDFDQAMGKINPDDYAAQRTHLVADGVAILKQLDALGLGSEQPAPTTNSAPAMAAAATTAAAPTAAAAAALDEIEAAVAQLRARRAPARRPAPVKPAPAKPSPASRSIDAEIEGMVAQRRAAKPAGPAAAGAGPRAAEMPSVAPILTVAEKIPGAAKLAFACHQCGTAVLPDDRFCPKCGLPLMIACGNCGRVARAGDQFCAQCGQALPALAGPATLRS